MRNAHVCCVVYAMECVAVDVRGHTVVHSTVRGGSTQVLYSMGLEDVMYFRDEI